ncbi:MAG TPA: hypothetical protein VFI25_05195 [Planctomycetota bacterium]|jgi:D-glycero-D-manno-heptose 1,7-bisphosphate phosphatase|nr:hypothetical protein [Planctomycetota bacterium]
MRPRKGLFIERRCLHDRAIPRRPPRRSDFSFPGRLIEGLREAQRAGLVLFVISNEEEVALGQVSPEAFARYASALTRALAARGVTLSKVYHCPFLPEGKGPFRRDSVHRLPNVGMMMAARHQFGVDPTESWLAGATTVALLAGSRAGCLTARVGAAPPPEEVTYSAEPDLVVPDLAAAVLAIVGHEMALTR